MLAVIILLLVIIIIIIFYHMKRRRHKQHDPVVHNLLHDLKHILHSRDQKLCQVISEYTKSVKANSNDAGSCMRSILEENHDPDITLFLKKMLLLCSVNNGIDTNKIDYLSKKIYTFLCN